MHPHSNMAPVQVDIFGRPIKRQPDDRIYARPVGPYQEFIEAYWAAKKGAKPKQQVGGQNHTYSAMIVQLIIGNGITAFTARDTTYTRIGSLLAVTLACTSALFVVCSIQHVTNS